VITFVRPWLGGAPSGGTRYDEAVLRAWAAAGLPHRDVVLPGAWPRPDADARAALARALAEPADAAVVDGLVGSCCPAELAAAGVPVTLLVHLPLDADPLPDAAERARLHVAERRAIAAASAVVVPSAWAAADLASRFGPDAAARVVRPGVDAARLARGSEPPLLLAVGALTPGKNHALLLDALAPLAGRPWTLAHAGPEPASGSTLPALRALAAARGLERRIRWHGVLDTPALARLYAAADLLLLPSLTETYGLVVTEALARGIPCLVAAGTGAVEALDGDGPTSPDDRAGAALGPGDPGAWTRALARWLNDPAVRSAWAGRARRRRAGFTPWDAAARALAEIALRGGVREDAVRR